MKNYFLVSILLISIFTTILADSSSVKSKEQSPVVKIETTMGDIFIKLDCNKVQLTCQNFLNYVEDKFYDETIFHRVIDGFIIQGGGFDKNMSAKKTRKPIKNEAASSKPNKRGTIAMALTNKYNSAQTQFFINISDNDDLDYNNKNYIGYTVFGEIFEGLHVIDRIKKVETHTFSYYSEIYQRKIPMDYVPIQPIIIKKVRILRK